MRRNLLRDPGLIEKGLRNSLKHISVKNSETSLFVFFKFVLYYQIVSILQIKRFFTVK